jgi:hypothetical protein
MFRKGQDIEKMTNKKSITIFNNQRIPFYLFKLLNPHSKNSNQDNKDPDDAIDNSYRISVQEGLHCC